MLRRKTSNLSLFYCGSCVLEKGRSERDRGGRAASAEWRRRKAEESGNLYLFFYQDRGEWINTHRIIHTRTRTCTHPSRLATQWNCLLAVSCALSLPNTSIIHGPVTGLLNWGQRCLPCRLHTVQVLGFHGLQTEKQCILVETWEGCVYLYYLILSGFYTHALDIWLHYGAKCLENINP